MPFRHVNTVHCFLAPFTLNKSSLVVKCGCNCAYTNENSDNGNQKPTSECGVSFKQKSLAIIFCTLGRMTTRLVGYSNKGERQLTTARAVKIPARSWVDYAVAF